MTQLGGGDEAVVVAVEDLSHCQASLFLLFNVVGIEP